MTQPYGDRIAQVASLNDDDLSALESDVTAAFDSADAADDLDAMAAAATALDEVKAEKSRRGSEAPADTEEAPADAEAVPVEAAAKVPDDEEVAEAEAEAEAAEEPAAEDEDEDKDKNPFVASADDAAPTDSKEDSPVDIPEDRKPVTASALSVVTAGADIPGVSAGQEFNNVEQINDAMARRIHTVGRARGGDGEQFVVATVTASASPDRVLEPGDIEGNLAKIREVTSREALTASGGYCAPLEVKYDIFGLGVTSRPVRDSLAGFQASRGGIRYVASPKLGDDAAAVGLWTAAVDADPDAAVKASLTVACAAEATATADALTLQMQFGNLMSRAYPELVARHNELGLIEHARLAERTLLSKIGTASTAVTSAQVLGTTVDFLNNVGRGAAAYRGRHRMEPTDSLRVIAPSWARDAIREDLARRLPGDNSLEIADAKIEAFFRDRNVNVTWHLDDTYAAQGAGAMNEFPATIVWYMFAEGTFLFLDGGTLDLGVVRDSTLVGTNDYKMFVETFEGVAKIGVEAIKVTTTTKIAGATAATANTLA